jgi:DNA-binding response OmpR family regulator
VNGQITVLVVDDDPSIRLLCRVNLELDGHEVTEAGTLEEARAVLAGSPVDLVILDVHVGGDDGRELLADLRSNRPGLPVAMLTGTADREELVRVGADALIPKPFTIDELRETVAQLAVGRTR